MRVTRFVRLLVVSVLAGVTLAGCAGGTPRFGGVPGDEVPAEAAYEEHLEEQRADQAARQAEREAEMDPPSRFVDGTRPSWPEEVADSSGTGGLWTCRYSPTWNDDWHDDVVCSDGSDSHRPYLRDWDSFVEEWEIMESAAQYEAELNAGR